MKKLILIIFSFSILVLIGYLTYGNNRIKYVKKEVLYCYVFLYNDDDELIGVKLPIVENEIEDIFSYLTRRVNATPIGYHSHLNPSTILYDYNIDGYSITMNISNDFLRGNQFEALRQLYYCYHYLNYTVHLKIEGEKVFSLVDVNLIEGIPPFLANPVFENDFSRIVNTYWILEDGNIKPISYLKNKE